MTHEEFVEKYANEKIKVVSYYKYSFHCEPINPDSEISWISLGGGGDDIYKLDIKFHEEHTVEEFQEDIGSVEFKNGEYFNFNW